MTGGRGAAHPRSWSLARQLLVLQACVVLGGVLVAGALAYVDADRDAEEVATQRTRAVATAVADSADVRDALDDADPSVTIQPYAERVRVDSGVSFITVMSPAGERYSHPTPGLVGGQFVGTTAPALAGRTFTETYTGTLGPSLRTVVPVLDGGSVVALVAVGISVGNVSDEVRSDLPGLVLAAAAVLAAAVGGTVLVVRRLRRVTGGMGPQELRRMHDYYDAVLHSVREGLLLVGPDRRVQVVNDEAVRLLALPPDAVGRLVGELGLPDDLAAAITGDDAADADGADAGVQDALFVTRDRVVAVNVAAVAPDGGSRGPVAGGRVVTFRDRTDLQRLTGELDTARGLAAALSSQAHESANRLHTVVSLVELGRSDEAVAYAVEELQLAQGLTDRVVEAVDEPVVAALLLGKSAVAAERGTELVLDPATDLRAEMLADVGIGVRDLVTVLGNLVDNAIDAVASLPVRRDLGHDVVRRVVVLIHCVEGELVVRVADSGPGLDPEVAERAFDRGWSTKARGDRLHGRGLGLALVAQTVARLGGSTQVTEAPPPGGAVFTVRVPVVERVR